MVVGLLDVLLPAAFGSFLRLALAFLALVLPGADLRFTVDHGTGIDIIRCLVHIERGDIVIGVALAEQTHGCSPPSSFQ